MNRSRRVTLNVEGMESRMVLSGATTVAPLIYPAPILIQGRMQGVALVERNVPDVGDRFLLNGSGSVGPLGNAAIRGSLQTSSISGEPIGSLTIGNRFGQVRLQITGRTAVEGDESYNFVIESATGRYRRLQETTGVLELTVGRAGPLGRARFQVEINPVLIAG